MKIDMTEFKLRKIAATFCAITVLVLLVAFLKGVYTSNDYLLVVDASVQTIQIYPNENGYSENTSFTVFSEPMLFGTKPNRVVKIPSATGKFRIDFVGGNSAKLGIDVIKTVSGAFQKERSFYKLPQSVFRFNNVTAEHEQRHLNLSFDTKTDPYLEIDFSTVKSYREEKTIYLVETMAVVLILFVTICIFLVARTNLQYLMFLALLFAFLGSLALGLPFSHGPDEPMHFYSGSWYFDNVLPPSVSDDVYRSSVWGSNYVLGTTDLTYRLSFKLANFVSDFIVLEKYMLVRLAQLFLIFGLLLAVFKYGSKSAAFAGMFALLSVPQLSFTATYINGDVLSFFLAYACLAIVAGHRVNRGLAIFLGLAIIPNLKAHYIITLIPFFYLYYLRLEKLKDIQKDVGYIACGAMLGITQLLFVKIDPTISGINPLDITRQYANDWVKQYIDNRVNDGLQWNILTDKNWYIQSFRSFFGLFGWMKYGLPGWYYWVLPLLYMVLLVHSVILLKPSRYKYMPYLLLLMLFIVNLGLSVYHSMSWNYQAQGRYIFPFLMYLVFVIKDVISRNNIYWLVSILTIYSMINYLGKF